MPEQTIAMHLVSDATGETLHAIARASVAQFSHVHAVYHRWNLVRTHQHLQRVLTGIQADPAIVLSSLMDPGLRDELQAACATFGLAVVNVLDPVLTTLQSQLGLRAAGRPGGQYVMDDDYFRRIDAMHFVIAHDDGQAVSGLNEADVVLVGVSRASKTPTSFYLANRGIKAANVPLVPDVEVPPELLHLKCPIIGLTINPRVLAEIRRHRLQHLYATQIAPDARWEDAYVDPDMIRHEVLTARRICQQHGWPILDVSHRSIEETAAAISDLIDRFHGVAP